MTTTTETITEPQLNLIGTLLDERIIDTDTQMILDLFEERDWSMSKKAASSVITMLFQLDRKDGQATTSKRYEPPEGCYRVGDDVYRVKISKSTGAWYAEVANVPIEGSGRVKLDWKYVGKRVRLSDEARMSDADAGRFLAHCVRCGAPLSDPDSIERGMGPVCAEKA
jgi:hypothetical protein